MIASIIFFLLIPGEFEAFEARQKELKDKGTKPCVYGVLGESLLILNINCELLYRDKDEKVVRPIIPLSSCLEELASPELIEDFYSPAIQAKTTATKCVISY